MDPKSDDIIQSISSINSFNGTNGATENKYTKMKNLITAIENYLKTRSEGKATLIKYLQALSLTMDLTIFDPHTNIAANFFISLYDLMDVLEPKSLTSWYCVDVLLNACKNNAARQALMKTYQFLPCLARLISDQLSTEKRTRLLRLMQDITCGIKIYWQIPQITHLITTLCKWIENQESDVVTLSLGVLVNLCYKNVTTVYILQKNADLKRFIRMCLALKGPIVEVYVCQMLIILENISGYVPVEVLPKLIDTTFIAVIEAYQKKDSILLKQIVEFFIESLRSNHNNRLNCYNMYEEQVNNILEVIENSNDPRDPECLSVILDFIHFLIELNVPKVSCLYLRIIPLALRWIQEVTVSYQALVVLKTIAVNVDKKEKTIFESLIVGLPMFMLVINSLRDDGFTFHTEYNKRLGALLQLLRALIQVKTIRAKVIQEIQEDIFTKIFFPLLGDDSPRSGEYTSSVDAVNLYVYALALVAELVECDKGWISLMNTLLNNKQIQVILAQAISQCPLDVTMLALELSSKSCSNGVAVALMDWRSVMPSGKDPYSAGSSQSNNDFFSCIPVKQSERLDAVLDNVETVLSRNEAASLATSQMMELYNYKISLLGQAERAAVASVDALTKHSVHLQHRITRLTHENTRLQQSEFHTTQKLDIVTNKKEELTVTIKDLENRVEAGKGKLKACQSQLLLKQKALGECEVLHKETENRLAEMTRSKNNIEEQHAKLQQLLTKVEETCRKLEKSVQKKEELLKNSTVTIANYSMQVNDLEKCLADKQKQLDDTTTALHIKSSILENITKMANSQL